MLLHVVYVPLYVPWYAAFEYVLYLHAYVSMYVPIYVPLCDVPVHVLLCTHTHTGIFCMFILLLFVTPAGTQVERSYQLVVQLSGSSAPARHRPQVVHVYVSVYP